ncbi:Importin subunit alpha-1, partial [Cyphomyrmex costatus]
ELIRKRKTAVELCKLIREDRLFNINLRLEFIDLMKKTSISYPSGLSVDEIVNYINSSDEMLHLQAIQSYERLGEEKNSVNDMIKLGIVSRYIELLESNNISFQFEITSLLNIITSEIPKKSESVIKYEVIPKLLNLLKHKSSNVAEQAVYVLRNMIDTPYARDRALMYDILPHLIDFIKPDTSITLIDNITWLLSNLYQRTQPLSLEMTKHILPVLNCLLNIENDYIISDTCRILSYVTDGDKDNVRAVMKTDILPKLLKYLSSEKKSIFIPALLTVRNIVEFGDDAHKDAIIIAGGLSGLRIVLSNCFVDEADIEREAFWIICKVAGSKDQIESIIDAGLLSILINRITHGNAQAIAAWAVTTMITRGTVQQFIQIVNNNVLLAYCALLHSNDYYNILCALTGLTKILHAAEKTRQKEILAMAIKKVGGFDEIEALQYHIMERIYKQSFTIMKLFFTQKVYRERPELLTDDTVASISVFLTDKRVHEIIQASLSSIDSDEKLQLLEFQVYRKLLLSPEISHSTLENVLPLYFEHLDNDKTALLLEAMSLLTDLIQSGSIKMQYIIKHGAIQKLVKQLKSTSSNVVEHAINILEKITKACPYALDLALEHNALPILMDLIKPETPIKLIDNITWLLSNLCQRTQPLSLESTKHILPVLNCLLNIENDFVTSDTCRILSYLTDGSKSNVRAIMETGILPKLLECLTSEKKSIFLPTLITIRNIVEFGDDAHKDAIITAGGLSGLRIVLSNCFVDEEDIEKEALWIICKVAGSKDQIQSVIDADLLPILINKIVCIESMYGIVWTLTYLYERLNSAVPVTLINLILPVLNQQLDIENQNLRSDTCKVLFQLTTGCLKSNDNKQAIFKSGIVPKIIECLKSYDSGIYIPALFTVGNIVKTIEIIESDASILAECLPRFRILLQHDVDDDEIREEVVVIISKMINNIDQIENVLNADLLSPLIDILQGENNRMKMISEMIIVNILSHGSDQHLTKLLNAGVLAVFYNNLMKLEDDAIIINRLHNFSDILDNAKENGQIEKFIPIFKTAEVSERLKALQFHQNEIIYKKSLSIINSHFSQRFVYLFYIYKL